jgi:Protein of unknown function (DUF2800)
MAPNAHSILGPSSAERWFACPGSINLIGRLPESAFVTSEYAAEGTVAHQLAEQYVSGKLDVLELNDKIGETVMQDNHEIEITEEMIDGVQEYYDVIHKDMSTLTKPIWIIAKAEVQVHVKSIDSELWGTADFLLYQKGHKLVVYDFKYGKGMVVDPKENPQMAIYAVAAMETEAGRAFDEVELVIVQPRTRHIDGTVRRWKAGISWFNDFQRRLESYVLATRDPKAPFKTGSWCRFCPAQAVCPAIYGKVQEEAKADFAVVPRADALPEPGTLSIEKLAAALSWEDTINSWYEALKLRALEILNTGGQVPGFKLVEGRSNRKWVDESLTEAKLGPVLGEGLFERKMISPAVAEKKVGKGKLETMGLTFKPEGKKAIAPNSDPRPEVITSAKSDFGGANALSIWPE